METYENFEEYLEDNYERINTYGTEDAYYEDMGGGILHLSNIEEEYQYQLDALKEY